jgi:hypothetical protein
LAGSSIGKGWNLKTGDGSVTLTVPETLAADVVLHTGDGHITLDMPLTVEGRYDSSNVRGQLNGGGGVLLIDSGDGSIRLGRSQRSGRIRSPATGGNDEPCMPEGGLYAARTSPGFSRGVDGRP